LKTLNTPTGCLSGYFVSSERSDQSLAECFIGLFKAEVIDRIGPQKLMRRVEWKTPERVYRHKTAGFLS
jgi:hypothetical protein